MYLFLIKIGLSHKFQSIYKSKTHLTKESIDFVIVLQY